MRTMRILTNYWERREPARQLRRTQTEAERKLWSRLRNKQLGGLKFRRQFPLGPFFADFFCFEKRLIVEVDGSQHADRKDEDKNRTQYLAAWGFKVIRFWNKDVLFRTDFVCEQILIEAKRNLTPIPLPRGEGGASSGEA